EPVGVTRRQPGGHGENVVTGLGLILGGTGEKQLVALRRDVVDLDFDLFLVRPLLDECGRRLVCFGNPVVPQTEGKFACSVGTAHEWRGNERGRHGGRGCSESTTSELTQSHCHPPWYRSR